MPKASFAIPSKAPGSGSFPINNKSHARNALARAGAKGPAVQAKVKSAVHAKFPNIGKPKHKKKKKAYRTVMSGSALASMG